MENKNNFEDKKIFSNIQQKEIIQQLNKRISPLKYCYMINAKEWIKFCENDSSKNFIQSEEQLLLINNLDNLFNKKELENKKLDIIEFGCGDGNDLHSIINHCESLNFQVSASVIDLSKDFLNLISTRISSDFNISIHSYVDDFEHNLFENTTKKLKDSNSLSYYILLGNTLGNMNNYISFLKNIFENMKEKDHLILGVHLYNEDFHNEYIHYYSSKENKLFDTSLLNFLGLDDSNDEFLVKFDEKNKSFNTYLQCRENFELDVFNSPIKFFKEERILLCKSKKFNSIELEEELKRIGFCNIKCFTNENKTQLLIKAQK